MPSVRSKSKGAWGSTPLAHHPSNGRLATLHEGPLCPVGNGETPIIPPADPPRGTLRPLWLSSLLLSFFRLYFVHSIAAFRRCSPPPQPSSSPSPRSFSLRIILFSSSFSMRARLDDALRTVGMHRDSCCKIHSRSPDYAYRGAPCTAEFAARRSTPTYCLPRFLQASYRALGVTKRRLSICKRNEFPGDSVFSEASSCARSH